MTEDIIRENKKLKAQVAGLQEMNAEMRDDLVEMNTRYRADCLSCVHHQSAKCKTCCALSQMLECKYAPVV